MLRNLKNTDFSKKIILFLEVIILLTLCIIFTAVLKDNISDLDALVTGVFSLASLSFGFYFWKAKNENIRKYAKNISKEDMAKILKLYSALYKKGGEDEADC